MAETVTSSSSAGAHGAGAGFWALTLGSIGVVYGDIGTSPLYAFREAMVAASGGHDAMIAHFERGNVLGIVSLILWALIIIVTIKYVVILLRADNQGEGGTLSLLALAQRSLGTATPLILLLGSIGAALFYGDAIITPAISVLSAVEGLKLVTPRLEPYILVITVAIIVCLFLVQSKGTAAVSKLFGPITLLWFMIMGLGGAFHISDDLAILEALNPLHGLRFIFGNGITGVVALGAVFLAVTGAEALYADLGHFGRKPIQVAWMSIVFPALALNYLGQGALVLANPAAIENPFYLLFPSWALIPVVIMATLATIIASQAVITGAFSLTRQAIQLRLLPRMKILHTSEAQAGQIYLPFVNYMLLFGVVILVFSFGNSSSLANAYGIAVTGTMLVTALLAIVVVNSYWKWPLPLTLMLIVPFIVIEFVFLGANMMKVVHGGYVPLLIALGIVILILTWVKGVRILAQKDQQLQVPLADIVDNLRRRPPPTIPGTAVFPTASPHDAPVALMHSLKHFKSLHEQNVILTVRTADVPRVEDSSRVEIAEIAPGFRRVTMTFG